MDREADVATEVLGAMEVLGAVLAEVLAEAEVQGVVAAWAGQVVAAWEWAWAAVARAVVAKRSHGKPISSMR